MPLPDQTLPEAVKGAIAIVFAAVASITLERWVMIGTLVYLAIQGAYLLRKWWREEKDLHRRVRR